MINYIDERKSNYIQNTSTPYLEELQLRVPVVGDQALINLINGIQVSKDIIRYRKKRGWFGQLFDKLDGSDNQRRLLLDGNLIAGQEALYKWVLELSDSLRISQVALEVTQNSLPGLFHSIFRCGFHEYFREKQKFNNRTHPLKMPILG